MSVYSIKELESLSDIKSHTIRIWEKRYGLLKPTRTETNIRVYDDEQLRKILNISMLIRAGFKISKLAKMSPQEIEDSIDQISQKKEEDVEVKEDIAIKKVILAGLTYDEELFNKIFKKYLEKDGIISVIANILYPALNKIGFMWLGNQMFPSQEHFVSKLMKRKLYGAIEGKISARGKDWKPKETWLLFLPDEEMHEIGLIFAHVILMQSDLEVIYLGDRVPINNLTSPRDAVKPTKVLYFLNTKQKKVKPQAMADEINKIFAKEDIYISGAYDLLHNIDLGKTTWLKSPNDLVELVS